MLGWLLTSSKLTHCAWYPFRCVLQVIGPSLTVTKWAENTRPLTVVVGVLLF